MDDVEKLTIKFYESLPEDVSQSMNYFLPGALKGFSASSRTYFLEVLLRLSDTALSIALVRTAFLANYLPEFREKGVSENMLREYLGVIERHRGILKERMPENFSVFEKQVAKYALLTSLPNDVDIALAHTFAYKRALQAISDKAPAINTKEELKALAKLIIGAHMLGIENELPSIYHSFKKKRKTELSFLDIHKKLAKTVERVKEKRIKEAVILYRRLNPL